MLVVSKKTSCSSLKRSRRCSKSASSIRSLVQRGANGVASFCWLGQELPKDQQKDATPFAPRCTKDRIEEALFEHRRDLFSELQLVFFDTTSIYFEGQ